MAIAINGNTITSGNTEKQRLAEEYLTEYGLSLVEEDLVPVIVEPASFGAIIGGVVQPFKHYSHVADWHPGLRVYDFLRASIDYMALHAHKAKRIASVRRDDEERRARRQDWLETEALEHARWVWHGHHQGRLMVGGGG